MKLKRHTLIYANLVISPLVGIGLHLEHKHYGMIVLDVLALVLAIYLTVRYQRDRSAE